MAKQETDKGPKSRADQVRAAVDQAFEVTASRVGVAGGPARERAKELADELSSSLSRFREALDDARPATASEIDGLRAEVASLAQRVETLEEHLAAEATGDAAAASERTTSRTRRTAVSGTASTKAKAAAAQTAAKRSPASRTSKSTPAKSTSTGRGR
jgi:chromosome segregation ATPase